MISANDLLQIIGEIHQYSMLLLELKNATTVGISHSSDGRVSYFRFEGKLGSAERSNLVKRICAGEMPDSVQPLSVEQFLHEIEGKKANHIWLEAVGPERRELAFVSIPELKAHFRAHSRH